MTMMVLTGKDSTEYTNKAMKCIKKSFMPILFASMIAVKVSGSPGGLGGIESKVSIW
jgi:hypothetical protein